MTSDWLQPGLDLDHRVAALLADLDPADLVAVALGDFDCLTSRGVPAPNYVDSGTGLRDVVGATAFPAGIALAATFDADLAEAYGQAVGAEARAAGFSVVLGPTLDLARDPRAGRIPEALGEDPELTGRLGAALVRGLQSQHVIAQLKHFIAYNGEDRRTGYGLGDDRGPAMDVRVSEQTLHDLYLRPFRQAVSAGAWSMMGSYNQINGRYVCESPDLLSIPRRHWGWRGFYCPDFLFAVRDDAAALAAGLDLGALGGPGRRTPQMLAAAPEGAVRAAVANLVRAVIGAGLADHPLPEPTMPSLPEHRDLAEQAAIQAAVLLKNQHNALPLGREVASVALIGPTGEDAIFVVGGSAAVSLDADRLVTPAAGVRARFTGRLNVAQGSLGDQPLPPIGAEVLSLPDGSGPGVLVEFVDAEGHIETRVLPDINLVVDPANPLAAWPRRWRTRLLARRDGVHRISVTFGGRVSLRVDGRTVFSGSREAERFIHGPLYPGQAMVELAAGVPVDLELDYEPGPAITIPPMGLGPTVRLGWQEPDQLMEQAVTAAAQADCAVVMVNMVSGEGMDRDGLALPGDQDELVRRVAAVNRRTVVVLNTPGAVLMPWLDEVSAVLQVWYPGERFGAALAKILFGDAEPGGRLPLTFPASREHLPGGDHGPEVVPTELNYEADARIGYRAPQVLEHGAVFGFGYGLGYAPTEAVLSEHQVVDGRLRLSVAVTNTGSRDGAHVVQVYARLAGDSPELVAFQRVPVAAGQTRVAVVELAAEAFARWDPEAQQRRPVPGVHEVLLATSSAQFTDRITVEATSEGLA